MKTSWKITLNLAVVIAAVLVMGMMLYAVWLFTDEGKDIVMMRLLTVGMLLFNQLVIMVMVAGVFWLLIKIQKAVETK